MNYSLNLSNWLLCIRYTVLALALLLGACNAPADTEDDDSSVSDDDTEFDLLAPIITGSLFHCGGTSNNCFCSLTIEVEDNDGDLYYCAVTVVSNDIGVFHEYFGDPTWEGNPVYYKKFTDIVDFSIDTSTDESIPLQSSTVYDLFITVTDAADRISEPFTLSPETPDTECY